MSVGLIYDPIYLEHDTGSHPENSQRLVSMIELLHQSGLLDSLTSLSPRMATENELTLVHTADHVAEVEAASVRGGA